MLHAWRGVPTPGADTTGARRPAHAGPEPGAPLSPGLPLGFRLPSYF